MSAETKYFKHAETTEVSVPDSFMSFLTRDIEIHPERLKAIDAAFIQQVQFLVENIDVDLDVLLQEEGE
ncbi:type II toxin-antitoxin system PrlF family antitoxin [Zwartia vadi]|uniref:type II toxin-antitoxin system PrlF family antitoxin n=1 Tax=Zwartia vadi TaxID=3058168 RepID=UPI0025B513EA|nr:type II toxin-antitoxin system PrlF family antitoxin [Zwartia vadi]MDN3987453.1 type II toxin-antitoxin system PrlF family antitoxin [Zwartia vadi]